MNHRHHRRERQNTDRSHKRIRLRNYAPWLRAAGGRPIFRIILAQQTQSRLGLKLLQAARPTCGLLRFHFDLCHFSISECPDAQPLLKAPRMMRQRGERSLATRPKCRFPARLLHFFAGLPDAISLRLTEL
jgi:hypothetical protein